MASPMSFIRQYQRVLMAVFGVLLMIIFLITMILPQGGTMMSSGGGSTRENPVVVKFAGGELTRADLDGYRNRFFMTANFVNRLADLAAQKKGSYVQAAMDLIPIRNPAQFEQAAVDESVLVKRLLINEAGKEGISIGDATIDDYLTLIANEQPFSLPELEKIARDATDNRMDLRQVRECLREELAAQQMLILRGAGMRFAMQPTPNGGARFFPNPTEALQFFNRANTLVSAEVVPFPVDDYLPKVTGTPTTAEMRKLFDEGQYNYPDPTQEIPGFKRFRRMNIQYFEADFNKFLEVEIAKVSDKELQDEYDTLVKEESPVVYETIPDAANDPVLNPNEDSKGDSQNDAAPVPEKSEGDGKSDPAPEKPAETPAAEPSADKPAEKEKKDGGLTATVDEGKSFFVSTGGQDPELPKQEPADPPKQDEPKQEAPKQEPAPTEPQKTESKPAGDTPPAAPTQDPPPQDPAVTPATETAPQEPNVEKKPEKKLRPLKDVADTLRRRIKGKAATDAMQKALEDATKAVRDHQNKMLDESDAAFTKGKEYDPNSFAKFDGADVAKKLGLAFSETGVFAANEYSQTTLGKQDPVLFTPDFRQFFPPQMFSDANLYEPTDPLLGGMGAKRIVMWFCEKHEQEIPTFDDAQEAIVKFWKHQRAYEAARTDAQKAADEANANKKPLTEKFGEKAKLTGQFSWYSTGMRFGLSQPVGVEDPGEDFMESVFAMKEGQVGIASNATRKVIYVVKVLSTDKRSGEDMNREFLSKVADAQSLPMEVQGVTENYLGQLNDDFNNEVIKKYNIQWIKN